MSPLILAVDDNPINLKLACDVLESDGYRVLRATNAEEALAIISKSKPDLILMDISMPGMDGLALTQKLKTDASTKDIVIVVLTASAMKGDEERARAVGCDGYITKPIDTRKLGSQVAAYLKAELTQSKSILVVDDNPVNRKLLRAILEGAGWTIIDAVDGIEALEILGKQQVTLIISDILMPRMDGYRLCFEVRKNERFRSISFIIYTSTCTSPGDQKLALDMGADRYLTKPAPAKVILDTVAELQTSRGIRPVPKVEEKQELVLMQEYNQQLVSKLEERNHELQTSEERFRELAEQIHEVFWISSVEKNQILYVSPAYEKIWGRTCQSLYTSPTDWLDAIHPEDRERVLHAAKTKQGSGNYDEEYRITRPDGAVRWIRDRAFPVRDQASQIVRIVGLADDITDRKSLEEQFRQSQKMEAIGQLAGGVAHDFNNLLTIIQCYTNFLLESKNLTETERSELGEVYTAAQMAASLTRQLLTFSRKQVLQFKPIAINQTVSGLSKMLRRVIGEDITLQTECSPSVPAIMADAGMIEQILMNLSVNSRDAMPNGGDLVISTTAVVFGKDSGHSERRAGEFVSLDVRDTGSGMPPEVMARIFEPFYTTKGVGKGTGLGLATVYGIVKQHQGWIEVNSEVGKGTTFSVFFPAAAAGQSLESSTDEKKSVGGTETILVVEDESAVRLVVRLFLERRGYKVLQAVSGIAALEVWETSRDDIDLVLTDMIMPGGINGLELGQQLTAEKPNLKVIYTTGYSDLEDRAGGFVLDPKINFIQKPYYPNELLRLIRDVLDEKGQF